MNTCTIVSTYSSVENYKMLCIRFNYDRDTYKTVMRNNYPRAHLSMVTVNVLYVISSVFQKHAIYKTAKWFVHSLLLVISQKFLKFLLYN